MTTQTRTAEGLLLFTWRRDQLAASGFSPPLASRIARDARYDIHTLIQLVEQGCPADLAARIVAPLDDAGAT
jgi:hypothetical protein